MHIITGNKPSLLEVDRIEVITVLAVRIPKMVRIILSSQYLIRLRYRI